MTSKAPANQRQRRSAIKSSATAAALVFAFGLASVGPSSPLAAQRFGRGSSANGGNHLLYIGTYAGNVQIFDEATERQIGEIKLQTGIPRSLILSFDRKKFYVLDSTLEKVEVVDIASRSTLSTFTFSSGNKKTRIRSMQVDPLERFMILLTRSATKLIDRWEISDVALELYDLREKKVTRTIPWPGGEVRENVNIRFSPDGKLLYFFGDDILIVETEKFTEVDTWALSRPIEQGLGRVSFGAVDDINDDPGFFTGLFSVQDPVQNRRIMGIGRVNLVGKSVEFHPIGPAEGVGFAMAPDRKRGYGLLQQIGRYEFWTFDLEQKKLLNRTMFDGRPRMALRVSSNGRLLYVFQAGATIDVYEAATFKYVRTIEMNADQTTNLFVLPRPGGTTDTGASR
jgi:peptidoglycan hydrolase-like protein with peptidoglycan-binding domain